MKRFLLFVCEKYYPKGGWEDFSGSYDVLAVAIAYGEGRTDGELREFHVVDSSTWEIVHASV